MAVAIAAVARVAEVVIITLATRSHTHSTSLLNAPAEPTWAAGAMRQGFEGSRPALKAVARTAVVREAARAASRAASPAASATVAVLTMVAMVAAVVAAVVLVAAVVMMVTFRPLQNAQAMMWWPCWPRW